MNEFDCGHIISEFNNGNTNIDNLIPVCRQCNSSMYTQNMYEFMIDIGIYDKNLKFQKIVKSNKKLYELVYNYKISKKNNNTSVLPLLEKKNDKKINIEVKPNKIENIESKPIKMEILDAIPNKIENIEPKTTKEEIIEAKTNNIENVNHIIIDDRTCKHCKNRFDYPCLLDRHLNSKGGCRALKKMDRSYINLINTQLPLQIPHQQPQQEILQPLQDILQQPQQEILQQLQQQIQQIQNIQQIQQQKQQIQEQQSEIQLLKTEIQLLKTQLQNTNTVVNKLQCKYCKFIFKKRSGLTQHINELRCNNLTSENIAEIKEKRELKLLKTQALTELSNTNKQIRDTLIE